MRDRCEDLPALVEHFARQVSAQNGWKPVPFSAAAIEALKEYAWPGNIRELRNVVERLLLLAGDEVKSEDVRMALPAARSGPVHTSAEGGSTGPLAQRVLIFEREAVLAELERHGRHVTQTAKALGLERSHLYKKCQQLGIDLQNLPDGNSPRPLIRFRWIHPNVPSNGPHLKIDGRVPIGFCRFTGPSSLFAGETTAVMMMLTVTVPTSGGARHWSHWSCSRRRSLGGITRADSPDTS